jgi:hypothetical protein
MFVSCFHKYGTGAFIFKCIQDCKKNAIAQLSPGKCEDNHEHIWNGNQASGMECFLLPGCFPLLQLFHSFKWTMGITASVLESACRGKEREKKDV